MSLPEKVVVGCIEYRITEPEPGFVVFSEAHGLALGAFKSRYSFTRHTDGGPTTIDNLALLCRHHHGVIHRTGWQMTLNPHTDGASGDGADGDQTSFFTITTPDGARLPTHHDRPPRQDQQPRQSRPAPA